MPPLRPLPNLCLITLFKMMPPNEQMVASKLSPRCAGLVRAANRTVMSLVITDQNVDYPNDLDDIKKRINRFSLASNPAMQPLMDIPGEPSFPDYPMTTTRLNKWNCLQIGSIKPIDTATFDQIVNIFSAVTDLKLIGNFGERLVPLLQHPKWQCQLTHFMVDQTKMQELITAINGLTALQYLALHWTSYCYIPELTILAQLKVVAFISFYPRSLLRSFERYATDNVDLQVHLISSCTAALLSLSQPLHTAVHSRIVRYGTGYLDNTNVPVPLLCSQFRFLTSLSISNIAVTEAARLFTSLSQLHQLVHLGLGVDFWDVVELPPARPLAQLNTVRALDLHMTISAHSDVQWLNLPVTMPNLQTIYIERFYCSRCRVQIDRYIDRDSLLLNSSKL